MIKIREYILKKIEIQNGENIEIRAIKAIEKTDGLYIEDNLTGRCKKIKIGNFVLRYVRQDRYSQKDSVPGIRHWFNIFYVQKKGRRYIKSKKQFFHIAGENMRRDIECRLDEYARLENQDKDTLNYFRAYLIQLENNGIFSGKVKKEEEAHTSEVVKGYIIDFMQLIYGREYDFLEIRYSEKNRCEYEEKIKDCEIRSNKDLFLYNKKMNNGIDILTEKPYDKIGFIQVEFFTGNPKYYIIHIPALKNLMEKEQRFPEEGMTSHLLNIGLEKLGLIATLDTTRNYKLPNGTGQMRLTVLRADTLIEMAYGTEFYDMPQGKEIKITSEYTEIYDPETENIEKIKNLKNQSIEERIIKYSNKGYDIYTPNGEKGTKQFPEEKEETPNNTVSNEKQEEPKYPLWLTIE